MKKSELIQKINALGAEGVNIPADTKVTVDDLNIVLNATEANAQTGAFLWGKIEGLNAVTAENADLTSELEEASADIAALSTAKDALQNRTGAIIVNINDTDYEVTSGTIHGGVVYTKEQLAENPRVGGTEEKPETLLEVLLRKAGQGILTEVK